MLGGAACRRRATRLSRSRSAANPADVLRLGVVQVPHEREARDGCEQRGARLGLDEQAMCSASCARRRGSGLRLVPPRPPRRRDPAAGVRALERRRPRRRAQGGRARGGSRSRRARADSRAARRRSTAGSFSRTQHLEHRLDAGLGEDAPDSIGSARSSSPSSPGRSLRICSASKPFSAANRISSAGGRQLPGKNRPSMPMRIELAPRRARAVEHELGDLDRVQRRALAQVVAREEEREAAARPSGRGGCGRPARRRRRRPCRVTGSRRPHRRRGAEQRAGALRRERRPRSRSRPPPRGRPSPARARTSPGSAGRAAP